jgi:hypothetical protein
MSWVEETVLVKMIVLIRSVDFLGSWFCGVVVVGRIHAVDLIRDIGGRSLCRFKKKLFATSILREVRTSRRVVSVRVADVA